MFINEVITLYCELMLSDIWFRVLIFFIINNLGSAIYNFFVKIKIFEFVDTLKIMRENSNFFSQKYNIYSKL